MRLQRLEHKGDWLVLPQCSEHVTGSIDSVWQAKGTRPFGNGFMSIVLPGMEHNSAK